MPEGRGRAGRDLISRMSPSLATVGRAPSLSEEPLERTDVDDWRVAASTPEGEQLGDRLGGGGRAGACLGPGAAGAEEEAAGAADAAAVVPVRVGTARGDTLGVGLAEGLAEEKLE